MYSAVLLTTFAWVLNRIDWISVILWFGLVIDLIIKIKYEEKLLMQHFPGYKQYKKNVKALIPRVW